MPRRPRIHISGVPLHLIQRGVARNPVFFSDDDCTPTSTGWADMPSKEVWTSMPSA
ncbi:hypothetical protein OOT00_10745 [Desulfobotulus sp. H1]|uniref:Transposase n=1 Tax=Desulfobotulus pelophilus TaxID=2823377 RepID=A0ABT3NAH5_9BACT|nr:hypothetical protein [Desulfobotulus pelophilus]MCW7754463.1 hypothetical protein [Desulfobotulus pelophilus]